MKYTAMIVSLLAVLLSAQSLWASEEGDYLLSPSWRYSTDSYLHGQHSLNGRAATGEAYWSGTAVGSMSGSGDSAHIVCDNHFGNLNTPSNILSGYLASIEQSGEHDFGKSFETSPIDGIASTDWILIKHQIAAVNDCGSHITSVVFEFAPTGMELKTDLGENLTIFAGLSYAGTGVSAIDPLAGVDVVNMLEDVSDLSWSVAADWSLDVGDGALFVFGRFSYIEEPLMLRGGAIVPTYDSGSSSASPEYTLIDIKVGYSSADNWEAAVFVENLTDEEAFLDYDDSPSAFNRSFRSRPRTVGVSANYNF